MLIVLSEDSDLPIYRQIVEAIKEQLYAGELRPGGELPPVRLLAESLGINLHTVRRAYQVLSDEGLNSSRDMLGILYLLEFLYWRDSRFFHYRLFLICLRLVLQYT